MSSIVMDDDDDVVEPLFVKFGHPFSNVILTPNSIKRKSLNTIYYNGCHELAYLHPNRYKPDPCVLREAGVNQGDKYFVLRFNSFKAHHDIDAEGLSLDNKLELVNHLKDKGKVFITTEGEIEPEFSQYKLKITSDRIHSLIYYATMFIGDSQTMTSESAILGTPALKCNSFAGKLSVPNQIEKYGLCYSFLPEHFYKMMQKIKNLINLPNLKQEWQIRRDKMLKDKIDVTSFYVWFVENYPESYKIMKENPDYQYNFR